jgi:hypothetical protein
MQNTSATTAGQPYFGYFYFYAFTGAGRRRVWP